jgi:hypothetical protein
LTFNQTAYTGGRGGLAAASRFQRRAGVIMAPAFSRNEKPTNSALFAATSGNLCLYGTAWWA